MIRSLIYAGCLTVFFVAWQPVLLAQNVSNYGEIQEPLLFLLREAAVREALDLNKDQQSSLIALNHRFDPELLASRTWAPDKSQARVEEILAATKSFVADQFTPDQQKRLQQIAYRTQGIRFILHPEAAAQLQLTAEQQSQIQAISAKVNEDLGKLRAELRQSTVSVDEAEKRSATLQTDQQKQILGLLDTQQQRKLVELVGASFDLKQLGRVSFRAPDLPQATTWINSPALTMASLEGKVVALHFWTFGCINCIHNYPWYREWHQDYASRGLVVLGVHTPEFEREEDVDQIRSKMQDEQLKFPVAVDNEKLIWQRWGNSMWPSVYLIDKKGNLRYWWYGELNWQGAGGQKIMAQRIEELLAE